MAVTYSKSNESAFERAEAKASKYLPEVYHLRGTQYRVQSETKPTMFYTVRLHSLGADCNCYAGIRGIVCKHIPAAKAWSQLHTPAPTSQPFYVNEFYSGYNIRACYIGFANGECEIRVKSWTKAGEEVTETLSGPSYAARYGLGGLELTKARQIHRVRVTENEKMIDKAADYQATGGY